MTTDKNSGLIGQLSGGKGGGRGDVIYRGQIRNARPAQRVGSSSSIIGLA